MKKFQILKKRIKVEDYNKQKDFRWAIEFSRALICRNIIDRSKISNKTKIEGKTKAVNRMMRIKVRLI